MQLKCKFYKRLKIEESDEANDDYVASDPTFLEDRGKSVIVAEAKYAKEGPDVKRTITQKRQYKRKKSINGPIVMETEDRPKKQPSSFPSLPGPKSTSLKTPCRIRVRSPTISLSLLMCKLSEDQKTAIREMGFASMLDFNIHKVPTVMGYWALKNFDHEACMLQVRDASLKVTNKTIHDVLGVPMGRINVFNLKYSKTDHATREFRKQFPGKNKIHYLDVINEMEMQGKGGRLFKLNFLVLFVTIMAESQGGLVNQKFLGCIRNLEDVRNMDWCQYILECLVRTRKGWNPKSHYNGPLAFLVVFYAHSINSKDMGKETLVPIIKTWTSGMLMKLEEKEFNIGRIEESAIQKWIVIESDDDVPVKDRMTSSKRKLRKNDTLESCTQVFEDGNNHKEAPENVSDVENASYHFDSYQQSPPPTAQATSSQPLSPVAPLAKVSCLPQTDSDTLPVSSPQFGSICVQGYNVKRSVAPILEAIFKKHGDIAAKCQFKTASVRSNFLEVVCEVVTKIEADDVIEKLEELEGQVSDAEAANINVSWLRSHLEALHKRKGAMKLMEMNANTILVQSAAMMDLKEISEELMTVQERFEKAERCVRVLHLVRKNIENTISERKAETDSWVKRRIL
uniref:uncharacterized protein LOC122607554 isoform X2 n=1 Tax=Erigeron canadensis TaxID=72917 RepID=UPI001CB96ADC|nr:uncharacterized protein LOC122607554 isoform X2 [Erigeron canadensis]